MDTDTFFKLFLQELQELPELYHYYKFLSDPSKLAFRKNYFMQRLNYVYEHVQQKGEGSTIWDCGCGYGTTCLFLAMNGIATYGSTLEFYYPFIEKRKKYWAAYGPAELFRAGYEDVMDCHPKPESIDIIIVQDTLHHLEPIDQALEIFRKTLRSKGIVIGIEENGSNIIQNLKLYKQRGNNRIITYWDEQLQKQITMGNENIRPIQAWGQLLHTHGMRILPEHNQYIRLLPPQWYGNRSSEEMAQKEQKMQNQFLRKYFYFGINFIAQKI